MILIDGLSVTYPGEPHPWLAVRDFTLSVDRGQHVYLSGPNGSGKSSICRVIAGVRIPQQGRVIVDGVRLHGDGVELRRRVAYVPDRLHWPAAGTVGSLLAAVRLPESLESGARGFAEALLEGLSPDARPSELSRGSERRLSLVLLGSRVCPVLVLDEPFVGIDAEHRDTAISFVRSLSRDRTIIISSHDRRSAESLTNREVVLAGPPLEGPERSRQSGQTSRRGAGDES